MRFPLVGTASAFHHYGDVVQVWSCCNTAGSCVSQQGGAVDPLSQWHQQPVPDFLSPGWNVSNLGSWQSGSHAPRLIPASLFHFLNNSPITHRGTVDIQQEVRAKRKTRFLSVPGTKTASHTHLSCSLTSTLFILTPCRCDIAFGWLCSCRNIKDTSCFWLTNLRPSLSCPSPWQLQGLNSSDNKASGFSGRFDPSFLPSLIPLIVLWKTPLTFSW